MCYTDGKAAAKASTGPGRSGGRGAGAGARSLCVWVHAPELTVKRFLLVGNTSSYLAVSCLVWWDDGKGVASYVVATVSMRYR